MSKHNLGWADIKAMDGMHPEDRNPPGALKQILIGLSLAGGVIISLIIGHMFWPTM